MAVTDLELPGPNKLQAAMNSPDPETGDAFARLLEAYQAIVSADIVAATPSQISYLARQSANAYASRQRLRRDRYLGPVHITLATDLTKVHQAVNSDRKHWSNLPRNIPDRGPTVARPDEWGDVAPATARVIAAPLGPDGISTSIFGLSRRFLLQADRLMQQPLLADVITRVEANDTKVKKRGIGLPAAIVGLGTMERLIAAHQLALASQLVPSWYYETNKFESSLARERHELIQSGPPLTWGDLFGGYRHGTSQLHIPGLTDTALDLQLCGLMFHQAAVNHFGRTNWTNEQFGAVAWRTAFEALDRAKTPGAQEAVIRVMEGLAVRDIAPFEALIKGPNAIFSRERRDQLQERWAHARARSSSSRTSQAAAQERSREETRDRHAEVDETAQEKSDLPGSLYWDTKLRMVVRIGEPSRAKVRMGNRTAGTEEYVEVPGYILTWFAQSADGMSADLTPRQPHTDASGRERSPVTEVTKMLDGDRMVSLGHTNQESLSLEFNQPLNDWLTGVSDTPLTVEPIGQAPPDDIHKWVLERDNELYLVAPGSYVSVAVRPRDHKIEVHERPHIWAEVNGEPRAVRVGRKTSRGHVPVPIKPKSPLDLWRSIYGKEGLTRINKVAGSVVDAWSIGLRELDAPLRIREVLRGVAVVPARFPDVASADAWASERIGEVYVAGARGILLGSKLSRSDSYPQLAARSYRVVDGPGGVQLIADETKAGGPDSSLEIAELVTAVDNPDAELVGWVALRARSTLYPSRIVVPEELMGGVGEDDDIPELEAFDFQPGGVARAARKKRNVETASAVEAAPERPAPGPVATLFQAPGSDVVNRTGTGQGQTF